jgi:hypothetical protein
MWRKLTVVGAPHDLPGLQRVRSVLLKVHLILPSFLPPAHITSMADIVDKWAPGPNCELTFHSRLLSTDCSPSDGPVLEPTHLFLLQTELELHPILKQVDIVN